jgi:5-methyltetrahydropteroyltriglutamate--homocysteine methyltransferase
LTPSTTTIGSYPIFPSAEDLDYYQKMVERGLTDELVDPFLWTIEETMHDFAASGIEVLSTGQSRGDLYSLFLDPRFVKGVSWKGAEAFVSEKLARRSSIRVADALHAKSFLDKHLSLKEPITDAYTLARFAKITTGAYAGTEELARDINKKIVIPEIEDLQRSGSVSMIQMDSPFLAAESSAPRYVSALYEEIASVANVPVVLHACGDTSRVFKLLTGLKVKTLELDFYHYPRLLDEVARNGFDQTIGLGVLDAQSPRVKSVDEIAGVIARARKVLGDDKISFIHPHCGERSLHREIAFEKNVNMSMARDDVYFGEALDPHPYRFEPGEYDPRGYFLVTVKRETKEIVVTFSTYDRVVVKRYKSRYAERLLQSINDEADSLGMSRRHLAYLTLEIGRAEAYMQHPSEMYRQKMIK